MSSLARWTYTNTAKVRPVLTRDKYGGKTYGEEYEIACTWSIESKLAVSAAGVEFTTMAAVFTEDSRPKYQDEIFLNGRWVEIKNRLEWDMSPFGDTPDFKLLT